MWGLDPTPTDPLSRQPGFHQPHIALRDPGRLARLPVSSDASAAPFALFVSVPMGYTPHDLRIFVQTVPGVCHLDTP